MNSPEQGAPLSFAQQSLWFLHELYPADSSSNEQFCLSLEGPLDRTRLAAAWRQLLLRHEVLRARFAEVNGQLRQFTDPPPAAVLPFRDLSGLTADELPGALSGCAEAALQTVLDPASGELCRALLLCCAPDRHLLLVTAQHMVADGLSVPVIRDELAKLYAAAGSSSADVLPGPVQYAAFSRQQHASMDAATAARMARWWQAQLAEVPEAGLRAIQLPAGDSEDAAGLQTRLPVVIDAELADALRGLARRSGCTLYMLLVAALRTVLWRYAGNQDLLIGTPMTWRDTAELRALVGCFVNPVALRNRLEPQQSFAALLKAERAAVLGAIQHRGLPFSQVVASLGPARRYGQHPLFQVLFNYELAPAPQLGADGVAFGITSIPARRRSAWELELGISDHGAGQGLSGFLGYAEALFEDWLISALPAQLTVLLAAVVRDPEQQLVRLELLDEASRRRLEQFNASSAPVPAGTLHERFLVQAAEQPDALALADRGRHYSYGELAQLTAVQAAALRALGVKVGDRIGLALPRSAELVCAMLAVLRAGAVIVPLDPGYPASRLKFMAEDAELTAVLTSTALAGQLPCDALPQLCLDQLLMPTGSPVSLPSVSATDPAWMLYTSGSTGQPKAATGNHRAAVNRCHWMWQTFGLGPDEVFSLRTSPNFIDVLWEVFGALLHGAPLVIIPDEVATDPQPLAALLAEQGVTQLVLVPSLLRLLLDEVPDVAARLASLRYCICSGEPLEPPLARRFMQTLPGVELLNTYGTSEIWDLSCYRVRDLPAVARRVPIGAPIANMQALVLDQCGEPVPIGVAGELVAAGIGVGNGYWQRPALSAERYLPDPAKAGSHWYRTGDLARWRADGQLECLGRLDYQVKLRGVRIELAEIEQVLCAHPAIARAAVGLRPGAGGEQQLLAWLLFHPGKRPDTQAVLLHAQARLPQAMLPQRWVVLDELPLTPSGKLDRARLPEPAAPAAAAGAPPRPGMESRLARLWSELLDCPVSSREENFFALGGHSLLAIRLLSRIRSQFGAEPGLRELFEAPLLWQQAARLEAASTRLRRPPLQPAPHDPEALPLSSGQRRLWFLDQLDPGSAAWNIAFTLDLHGPLDMAALHAALAGLEQRHELLRSCFPAAAGQAALRIRPATGLPLELLPLPADEATQRQLLAALAGRPLDLATGPLLRLFLLRASEQQHTLLFVIHHIISDATSNHLLFAEFSALYRAGVESCSAGLAPLPVRYVDYAAWQQRWLDSGALGPALAWWQARLAGAPARLELPADFRRPAEQDFAGAWHSVRLPAALHLRLHEFARAQGTTSFVVLLAAFKVLLARLSGQSDVLVGTPVEGRLDQASEGLLGLFINTLVLRSDLSAEHGFAELVTQLAGNLLAAQEHQELPFEQLVEQLAPVRSLSHAPVFQVMFNLVRLPRRELHAAGLRIRLDRLIDQGISPFDLTLTAAEDESGTELIFEYATRLFRPRTIARWADHYLHLLESALQAPAATVQALPLLRPEEQQALVAAQAASPVDNAALCPVHELLRQQIRRHPEATALVDGERCLSYAALGQAVDRLATVLAAAGAAPATRVAICLPRSAEAVVAVLATLETGAAYVLLDPQLPRARLELMLAAVGPQLLIAADSLAVSAGCKRLDPLRLSARQSTGSARWSSPHIPLQSPACLQFTSGTSGVPKAVTLTHLNLASMQAGWQQVYAPAAGESHLQMAGIAFDVFNGDWMRALCSGGRLVFCAPEVLLDPPALHALLHEERIRIAEFVPAVVRNLLGWMEQQNARLAGLRLLIVGSDIWHGSEYLALRARCATGTRIINSYGLAECCIDSSWYEGEADPQRPLPIGRAFPGTALYVLDACMSPVPAGVVGELYIGGAGVALGYHGLGELTAARFVADPFSSAPGARLYRSGDRARFRADGELELLGRLDEQIKLRGFRIEPGEIEQQILQYPGLREAVVVLREDRTGDARLVAYVVGTEVPERSVLSAWLGERLPEYMVPSLYVMLERLPLTANGKVARRELPVPEWESVGSPSVGPRTAVEEALCGLFAEVLGVVRVGIHDDFFALGGHSLLATQLVSRIRDALSVELPLRALFITPTVAGLATAVAGAAADAGPALRATARSPAPVPASLSQQRLWFLHRLRPASTAYHLHVMLHLDGLLDVPALAWSLQQVVARHEVLRSRIIERDGEPWQEAVATPPALLVEAGVASGALQRRLADLVAQPFELAAGPLFRLHLVPLSDRSNAQVLLLVMHHIISDGWSITVFFRELAAAYAARRSGDAWTPLPLPLQYADFARWQRDCLQGDRLAQQLDWWREQLAGAPATSRPPVQTGPACTESAGDSAWHIHELPADLLSALRALARAQRCTLFMVLFAGFALLLSRLAGQADLLIGTPVAGRQRTALEGLIGFFVNTLVLRADLSGNPRVDELLARIRQMTLDAYAHQDLPFEKIVEALSPERQLAVNPLIQVLFVLHNQPPLAAPFAGLQTRVEALGATELKFDLAVHAAENSTGLELGFGWNTALFSSSTIERWCVEYEGVLRGFCAQPEARLADFCWLSPPRRAALPARADGDLLGALAAVSARHPQSAAVVTAAGSCSYAELARLSNRMAHALLSARGPGSERVGLWFAPGAEMVAALLAVLKAGKCFVPLDPALPAGRLAAQVAAADIGVLLAGEQAPLAGLLQLLPEAWSAGPQTAPVLAVAPESLAYLLYTSGTTAEPKAVMQTHGGLLAQVAAWSANLGLAATDRLSLLSGYGYDAAIQDVFGALLSGAGICPLDVRRQTRGELLFALGERAVTVLHATPTVFRYLLAEQRDELALASVRLVVLGGEEARRGDLALFRAHCRRGAQFVNGYGLTECTVALQWFADHETVVSGESLPVGLPVGELSVRLLDEQGAEAGLCGEIVLCSQRLSPGYWPGAAAPEPERVLATGDLARRLGDGQLVWMGRRDAQLKLGGQRIEPGEIEAVLARHPAVAECAAGVRGREAEARLVAWYVPLGPVTVEELRAHLLAWLPAAWVPVSWVALAALPRRANGKLQRERLALPAAALPVAGDDAPATELEAILLGLWQSVLDRPVASVGADFFALGGHSLLATRLIARIRDRLGVDLPLIAFFEQPTIRGLASLISEQKQRQEPGPDSPAVPLRAASSPESG